MTYKNLFTVLDKSLPYIGIILIISLFLKSFIDIDGTWDTWNYHLPFAARLWGLVPPEEYIFENQIEYRYQGFPLLPEFFQGFFWFIFNRVQATNLVCFTSFLVYLFFLKKYLQIPVHLSAISLLAVPMVQIHSTSSYVDLFTNICISILIMMTYLFYTNQINYTKNNGFVVFAAAACAANSKLQVIPIILLALCFMIGKFVSANLNRFRNQHIKKKEIIIFLSLGLIGFFVIFWTPIKNTVLYGNPAYPVKIEVLGTPLNYREGIPNDVPDYLQNSSRIIRWIYSILEVNAFDAKRSVLWVIDQGNVTPGSKAWVMGGYFGIYVLINIAIIGYISCKKSSYKSKAAIYFFIIISSITAIMPQSHVLRFYMYWIICLVSLNLHLICTDHLVPNENKMVNVRKLGLTSFLFLTLVILMTKGTYILPHFYSLDARKRAMIDNRVLEQIHQGDKVCIVGKQPDTFLYASKFYKTTYSIKAAHNSEECGLRKVIQ
ncbi:hypothetical protein F7734_42715 [Scytonema sp. UIC 10036]|uniref:hypothetical protein n=1 Tax=Scytonema sp. UIC 10036 TaxID=2304196 RepID=UPI0012DA4D7C|nr:hypothetical protein [Scytonema sp. UIC 10036]MUG98648.1 hypothetical protein [Scytonema sp. UIC 10036]